MGEIKCPVCGNRTEKWNDFRNSAAWYLCHRCRIAFTIDPEYYLEWEEGELLP